MPLSTPSVAREQLHTRSIEVRGYRRADGLIEVEGRLRDTKPYDLSMATGERRAGEPIHEMGLRITVDSKFNIVDAEAASDAVPYPGACERIAPDYRRLIGMKLEHGFSARVRAIFSGTRGCTHLSDLIGVVATTVFQSLAGEQSRAPGEQPFQLGKCHALALDGPVVGRYYPRWHRPGARSAG